MAPENNSDQNNPMDQFRNEKLRYRKWALVPVLFFYVFGGGMTLYIVPEYIQGTIKKSYDINGTVSNVSCGGTTSSINEKVQAEAARWNIYLALVTYIPAIFMNLVLGSYTDLIGRKTLLVICLSGAFLKISLLIVVIKLELDLAYFMVGNFIEGITGAFTTLLAVSFSYISDLTKVGNQRTFFIVLLELVLTTGLTLSSITTGYFIKHTGFFYPSIAGSAISFVGVITAIVALPETRTRNRDSTTDCTAPNITISCSNLLQTLRNIWDLYFGQNRKSTTAKYIILLLAFMFTCIPLFGSFDTLYQLGAPFCWSSTRIGWYAALRTGLSTTVGFLSAFLLKKWLPDEGVAAIGIMSMIAGLVMESLVKTTPEFYIVPLVNFPSSLPIPMIRSLMSHMTSSHLQGALFASIGSIETICILLGSLTTNAVYAATLKIMNGFVFLVSAMYAFVGLIFIIVFMVLKRRYPNEDEHTILIPADDDDDDVAPVDLNNPD